MTTSSWAPGRKRKFMCRQCNTPDAKDAAAGACLRGTCTEVSRSSRKRPVSPPPKPPMRNTDWETVMCTGTRSRSNRGEPYLFNKKTGESLWPDEYKRKFGGSQFAEFCN
mmetsp:Transcript_7338/g.14684  ORF Transcript_7338/g.14684 Transcript_7338/m.14684 type:complete len:110 (+) Transcript_7338:577-906(+)